MRHPLLFSCLRGVGFIRLSFWIEATVCFLESKKMNRVNCSLPIFFYKNLSSKDIRFWKIQIFFKFFFKSIFFLLNRITNFVKTNWVLKFIIVNNFQLITHKLSIIKYSKTTSKDIHHKIKSMTKWKMTYLLHCFTTIIVRVKKYGAICGKLADHFQQMRKKMFWENSNFQRIL